MLEANITSFARMLALVAVLAACGQSPTAAPEAHDSRTHFARRELPRTSSARTNTRLLACRWTSGASAESVVGREGGSISIAVHTIRIAPGALAGPTTIRVTVPAGELLALQVELASRDEGTLIRPVDATISYARCPRQDLRRRTLTILSLGEQVESITPASEGVFVVATDDPESLEVSFQIVHRGTYAVAY